MKRRGFCMRKIQALVLLLAACAFLNSARADTYGWDVWDGKLADYKKDNLEGWLCWEIKIGDELYDYDAYQDCAISINLKDGSTKTYQRAVGYIIQKDDREYSGVLLAREKEDGIAIYHQDGTGINEIVYQGAKLEPFEFYGRQTIRAYMNGCLYYIKALEAPEMCSRAQYREDSGDWLYVEFPSSVPGQFCRIDANGEEHAYQLKRDFKDRDENKPNLIDGYAIHPNGTLAWVESVYETALEEYTTNRIVVESPDGDCRTVVEREEIAQMGYDHIAKRGMCWLDDQRLIFTAYQGGDYSLLVADIQNGGIERLTAQNGKPIVLDSELTRGSGYYLSPDRQYIAYMGLPNKVGDYYMSEENFDVPFVIDLRTGKVAYVYQYPNRPGMGWDRIVHRQNHWQLSWYTPSR